MNIHSILNNKREFQGRESISFSCYKTEPKITTTVTLLRVTSVCSSLCLGLSCHHSQMLAGGCLWRPSRAPHPRWLLLDVGCQLGLLTGAPAHNPSISTRLCTVQKLGFKGNMPRANVPWCCVHNLPSQWRAMAGTGKVPLHCLPLCGEAPGPIQIQNIDEIDLPS